MHRDFVELKGLTNLGYSNAASDAISRFWIRSSVDFKILGAKFHILGRKAQLRVWTKMYHLMDHFVEFFWMPLEMYSLV